MTIVQERYSPHAMAANASYVVNGPNLGGFIAVTAGTITVTDALSNVLLNAFPVAAGLYYPLPMYLAVKGAKSATVQLAGGASGTLLV